MGQSPDDFPSDSEPSFEFFRGLALFIGYLYAYRSIFGIVAGLGYIGFYAPAFVDPSLLEITVKAGSVLIWTALIYIFCINSVALPQERIAGFTLFAAVVLDINTVIPRIPEPARYAVLGVQFLLAASAVFLVHWTGRYRHRV